MKVSLKIFVNYAKPRPKHFLFYSICLELIAWLALLDIIISLTSDISDPKNIRGRPYSYILVPYLLFLFIALRRVSKRYRLNPKKMLLTDTREPVLYLRAFYEESVPNVIYYDKAGTDETLAKVFKNVGPLVAVGKPSNKQQPLGAIRVYFNDEVWQENVKTLMSMSKLVVIQAGCSPGLEWEIATAIKYLKPQQLLFTFLSWQELEKASRQSKFIEFATQLKLVSNFDLPKQIDDAYFLYFDREWNPHFAWLSRWKIFFFFPPSSLLYLLMGLPWQGTFHNLPQFIQIHGLFRKTSITSVREALRPVLKTQGIRLPALKTALNISFILGIILIISFTLLIYLYN
jgi:hypothetical protein